MRERAIKQGLKLNEYGLFDAEDKFVAGTEEEEVFQKLGLPFIPPVLREDQGEMEAQEVRLDEPHETGDQERDPENLACRLSHRFLQGRAQSPAQD